MAGHDGTKLADERYSLFRGTFCSVNHRQLIAMIWLFELTVSILDWASAIQTSRNLISWRKEKIQECVGITWRVTVVVP